MEAHQHHQPSTDTQGLLERQGKDDARTAVIAGHVAVVMDNVVVVVVVAVVVVVILDDADVASSSREDQTKVAHVPAGQDNEKHIPRSTSPFGVRKRFCCCCDCSCCCCDCCCCYCCHCCCCYYYCGCCDYYCGCFCCFETGSEDAAPPEAFYSR